jgi:hypothetical protein
MPTYMNPDGTVTLLDPRRKDRPVVLPPDAGPLLPRDTEQQSYLTANPYDTPDVAPGFDMGVGSQALGMGVAAAVPEYGMTGEELDALDQLAAKYQFDPSTAPPNDENLISQWRPRSASGNTIPKVTEADLGRETKVELPASQKPSDKPAATAERSGQLAPAPQDLTAGEDEADESPAQGAAVPSAAGPSTAGTAGTPAVVAAAQQDWKDKQSKAGQYSPGSKAKWEYQSASTKVGLPELSPETSGKLYGAYEQAGENARKSGDYIGMLTDELSLRQARASDEARYALADARTRQFDQKRELDNKMASLDRHIYETRSLANENPVDRYWARKGGLGSFMTKLGIAFGDLGSAVTGQPNRVYQQVRDEIEDEFNFQKSKVEHERYSIGEQRGALAEMRANFSSLDAADAAARSLMLEAAASETRAYATLITGEQARQAGLQVADQLSLESAKFRAKSEEMEADQISLTQKYKPAVASGPGKPADYVGFLSKEAARLGIHPLQVDEMIQRNQLPSMKGQTGSGDARLQMSRIERQIVLPDTVRQRFGLGSIETVYSSKSGKDIESQRQTIREGERFVRNIDRIKEILSHGSWESLPSQAKAEIQTLASWNAYKVKKTVLGEALTASEKPTWENLTGANASHFWSVEANNQKNLDTNKQQMLFAIEDAIQETYIDPMATPGTSLRTAPKSSKAVKKE